MLTAILTVLRESTVIRRPQSVAVYDVVLSAPKSMTLLWVACERAANDARAAGDLDAAARWAGGGLTSGQAAFAARPMRIIQLVMREHRRLVGGAQLAVKFDRGRLPDLLPRMMDLHGLWADGRARRQHPSTRAALPDPGSRWD